MCPKVWKVSHSSWKGLNFVDNIIHLTKVSIHTQRTCNIKPAHICTKRKSLCKLTNHGNLGKITNPTYFISNNRMEEMLAWIIITTQMPSALCASKSQTKIIIDVGGFHLGFCTLRPPKIIVTNTEILHLVFLGTCGHHILDNFCSFQVHCIRFRLKLIYFKRNSNKHL